MFKKIHLTIGQTVSQQTGHRYLGFKVKAARWEGREEPTYYLELTNKRGEVSGFWSSLKDLHDNHVQTVNAESDNDSLEITQHKYEVGDQVRITDAYAVIGTITHINVGKHGLEYFVRTVTDDYNIVTNWYTEEELGEK